MSTELRHITLTREDDWWVAKDEDTGVASQGPAPKAALENLDEAVELTREAEEANTRPPNPTRHGSTRRERPHGTSPGRRS